LKILLIYNPQAGNKRAKKLLPKVEQAFSKYELDYDLHVTEYAGHGIELIANADFENYDGIVAAGGDGILFEVVNGYFKNSSKKRIPIGVLPVGTGNAFARELNLENSSWEEAVKIISLNRPRKVDVGKFKTNGKTYYYLNILGMGFVADVVDIVLRLKAFGALSYTLGVLYRTIFLKSADVKIEIDGKSISHDVTFIEVSNTKWTANFLMAPNAEIDDGLLDVTIAKKIGRIKLLKFFPKIFTGEHINLDEVETYKARKIKIESKKPKVLTPDGELLGTTPVEIECLPQSIEIFWK
jgi:diacylglycerol kinase (ATP)